MFGLFSTVGLLLLANGINAQSVAPAPAPAILAPVTTSVTSNTAVVAVITSPGDLVNGQPALYYGNVSAAVVQAACAKIASGASTVNVSVAANDGSTVTEPLSLYNSQGGSIAATSTGTQSATQVAQSCANSSPNAQGTEFLFKDPANNQFAVICDGQSVSQAQASQSPFAKDTSLCRVYLLGPVPHLIIQVASATNPSQGVTAAPPAVGDELTTLVADAFAGVPVTAPPPATAGGRRRLSQTLCGTVGTVVAAGQQVAQGNVGGAVAQVAGPAASGLCAASCGVTNNIGCVCISNPALGSAVNSAVNTAQTAVSNAFSTVSQTLSSIPAPSCFPSNMQVDVLGAGLTPMSQLRVGDKVASIDSEGARFYDPVYFFGHQSKDSVSEMVALITSNATITLSTRHFVPVGPSMQSAVMKYAKDVVQGDQLLVISDQGQAVPATVTDTARTIETGLFNPYTQGGKLLVSGVLASAHSEFVLDDVTPAAMTRYLPSIYQAAFKPVYWLYSILGADFMQAVRPEMVVDHLSFAYLPHALGTTAVVAVMLAAAVKMSKK